jgi:hypothetical protein
MSLLFFIVATVMTSCAFGPGVYYGSTGRVYAHTGGSFMAARKEVIAEVETKAGDKIKYMAKGEEADDVPLAVAAAYGMVGMAKEATATTVAKEKTVQHAATQTSAQHAATTAAKTQVTTEAIKAGNVAPIGIITPP